MRKVARRLGSFIIIMVLLLSAFPMTAYAADHTPTDGATFDISACTAGDTVTIATGSGVTLTGSKTNLRVICGEGVSLTLDGVTITNTTSKYSPIIFNGQGNTLTVTGTNTLKGGGIGGSGVGAPGISVTSGAALNICGAGILTATGGYGASGAAGIGGNGDFDIAITSGTIVATAGYTAKGYHGEGICAETIFITGGTVTATGYRNGPGIGGSMSAKGSTVTISGGTVTATGNQGTPGIGGYGNFNNSPAITISGGRVIATGGSSGFYGSGIGSSISYAGTGSILLTGGEIFANCRIQSLSSVNDIGSSGYTDLWTLDISGSAKVFLQNGKSVTPTTATHTLEVFSTTGAGTVYGISLPDGWTAPFSAYLPLSTLSYDMNGGTGSLPGALTQLTGTTAAVAQNNGFSRTGYSFYSWNTAADGSGKTYRPGDTLIFGNDDVTLYAQWIEIIPEAGVSGITAPAAGALPQAVGSLAAGHASYTVTNLTWQNSDGSPASLTDDGKFKTASAYKAVIEFTAKTGYKFQALTPTADVGTAGAGTINTDAAGNKLTFAVTFPTTVPGVPSIQSVTAGDEKVSLIWSTVPGSVNYRVYSSTASGIYTIPSTTVAGAVYNCDITGLTNGTAYYFVVTAVNPGGESIHSNEVRATPRTVPGAPINVKAAAGNGQATVSFTPPTFNGGGAITGYTVTSSPGNITATGTATTITITGLSNGTAYTFTVTAANAAGTGAASPASNVVTPYKPSSGDSDDSDTPSTPATSSKNTGMDILVNGQTETAAAATTTMQGNKTVTTVVVDDKKIAERLEHAGSNAIVTIPVNNGSDVVIGTLNGQTIKNMEAREAVLEIKTGNVTYTLPAAEINIDDVSSQIGTQVELKDIMVRIIIAEPDQDTARIVEGMASKNNYQVVVTPIELKITCSSGDKTVDVSRFNSYVERVVAIPDGIDPRKISTGIVLNTDGTLCHVPTTIVVMDGKYYAKINSLTNSTYSVIYNPKSFVDVNHHWAKAAINDMASRLVINGAGKEYFEPDRDITRAEFASILVRALGIKPGIGSNPFTDVDNKAWYCEYINTAVEYKLISGYSNGKFVPDDKITREQAITMVARAMSITSLEAKFANREMDEMFAGFGDAADLADYARNSIAACVKTGIISGRSGNLIAPKDNITRAEVAVIVQRLLQKSGLI